MRWTTTLQATLACIASFTQAAKLTVSIPVSPPLLPNPAALPPSTHATLLGSTGQYYDALLTRTNTLEFKDLAVGSYLLNVHTRDFFFPPYRVDVSLSEAGDDESQSQELIQVWQTFMGNEWSNKGPSAGEQRGEVTITLPPNGRKDYYQRREGFSLLSFFKSPMILMGLFSVAMIFGMPYLMDNSKSHHLLLLRVTCTYCIETVDPETKAEFEEMQKKSPITGSEGAASQIQNFDLASWMAGKSSDAGASNKATSGNAKAKR